jgi:hypothetical protein
LLNLPEFPGLVERYRLPAPNVLSPLPDLCMPEAKGAPRPIEQVAGGLGLPSETVRKALLPLAIPDRVIDIHCALFNSAPSLSRLYGSRRAGDRFVALRHGMEYDRELAFPFGPADVVTWLFLQLQYAPSLTLPAPQSEFTAEELAFFLATVDAYKAAFVQSFVQRRPNPEPITVTVDDIVVARQAALEVRDRRWITTALEEMLGAMVHTGGRDGVHLPHVSHALAESQVARCVGEGHMQPAAGKAGGLYELGLRWAQAAGDLFTWLSLISIHDLQITGGSASRPEAWEEMLVFVGTSNTVWVLASSGLGQCQGDLSGVRFGLSSCGMGAALGAAAEFLKTWPGATVADDFYAPASRGATPGSREEPVAGAPQAGAQAAGRARACQACGMPVPAGKVFCGHCGARLEAPRAPQPPAAACPACRERVEPGQRFCHRCGGPLVTRAGKEPS